MECSICLGPYNTEANRPMVMPCGHTFCRECVEGILAATGECPNDRRPLNTALVNIPINYDLLFAIEILEKQQTGTAAAAIPQPAPPAATPALTITNETPTEEAPPKVQCRGNHELKWKQQVYAARGMHAECDDCDKAILESWNCTECEFDLCLACYAKRAEAKLGGLAVPRLCPKKHPLWWTEDTYKLRGLYCECDQCDASITSSWHCGICQYDLCKACYKKKAGRRSCVREPPKCLQNHRMKWFKNPYKQINGQSECDRCGQVNLGSWHCRRCRYDLCGQCVPRTA